MSTNPFEPPQFTFQPQQPQQHYGYQPEPPQNNMAVGALVCGILGMILWCCPLIGFPVNIAAIALGAMSMRPPNKGLAIAGLSCGILGMILTVINAIAGAMLQVWQMQNPGQDPFSP
jgi:hypothetical protein